MNIQNISRSYNSDGATAKVLGTDAQQLEHDIIQSGWGRCRWRSNWWKRCIKRIRFKRCFFDKIGDYTIKLKLIDRDNSGCRNYKVKLLILM